jgi:small-conductance mechanosensitive channel
VRSPDPRRGPVGANPDRGDPVTQLNEWLKWWKELYQTNAYVSAGTAILAAVVLGIVVDLIVRRVFKRLAARTKTELDDVFVAAIRKPLFTTLVLAGIGMATTQLDPPDTAAYIVRGVLISIAVLLWTSAGFAVGKSLLGILARRADQLSIVNARTLPLFEIVVKTVLVAGAAYGILLAWKVDVTAWLASAGILGIAIGFAAKDTLSNFFSGIFILADAPYKLGDFIVLGSGERGRVTDIGIRSTRILTRDDIEITIPNAAIANSKIINETGGPHDMERVRVDIGVAYGSDIDKVREVLMDVADQSKYVVKEPTPRVRFRTFGDSSLNFQLMGWIDEPVLRGRALDELNCSVYKRFQAEGIEIPYPQRDVHLIKGE